MNNVLLGIKTNSSDASIEDKKVNNQTDIMVIKENKTHIVT